MAKTQTSAATPKARAPRAVTKKQSEAAKVIANQANLEKPKDEHVIPEEQRVADRRADDIAKSDAANAAMQFAVQQLTAPVAPQLPQLTTPPAAQAAFEAELAALQAKHGVTAQVTIKPPKAVKDKRNDVTRPSATSICGKIWAAADAISDHIHGVCSIASLKEHEATKGVNEHTIKTQYARWRQFNGVKGRLPKIHAVHQQEGEYDGLKPVV